MSGRWLDLTARLNAALRTYDWTAVEAVVAGMVAEVRAAPGAAVPHAEGALSMLRRKRRFRALARLADVFYESGSGSFSIGQQYVQALIDMGYLAAAERLLDALAPQSDTNAQAIVLGLRGRIAKQRHLNAADAEIARRHLADAVHQYLEGFNLGRTTNHWQAVNAMALIKRAARRKIPLDNAPDADALAAHVLQIPPASTDAGEPAVWTRASHMEAHLARGAADEAQRCAAAYSEDPRADAFELASTLRQVTEVWELESGSPIVLRLRAGLLRTDGSEVRLNRSDACGELEGLEKAFGPGNFRNLPWYQQGLKCCGSIARIQTQLEQPHGTGWLVREADLRGNGSNTLLLVTNAHVVADRGGSLRPQQAFARFELHNHVSAIESIVWSSPVQELDTSVLKLADVPDKAEPLALAADPLPDAAGTEPRRLYIVGHPGGRGLEFSLHDNLMLGCNDRRVHYRTATEGGSSGSPVFEQANWNVVALHHAGKDRMPKLDAPDEVYEANEGIPIEAIRTAIRQSKPD